MKLQQYVETASQGVIEALEASHNEEQAKAVSTVIQEVVIKAILESRSTCVDAAKECYSADRNLAHKVAEEIRLANTALVANLSSMR